jgi:hypothetical protein
MQRRSLLLMLALLPAAAKASALVSIALWIGVIACGRLLAYT